MDESLGDITILEMDESLRNAANQGSIDTLYSLIEKDAYVLDRIDEIPFVETPLHIAASVGQTRFALEIMRLKPSFVRKLNQNGFTPVHVALQNDQTQLVVKLLEVDEEIVRVKGKEGVTPLHYIAQLGNTDLLADFLKACPKSIEDVTIGGDTVLHIALKNNKIDACQLLLGWLRRAWFKNASSWEKKLLNWRDEEGSTVLHIAASKNEPEIVRLILNFGTVDINAIEFDKLKEDNQQIKIMLHNARRGTLCRSMTCCVSNESDANYFKSPLFSYEKIYIKILRLTQISNDMRNVYLVVAALLVTVSFQAALSPPGGVWQEEQRKTNYNMSNCSTIAPKNGTSEHSPGTAVMGNIAFPMLAVLNGVSFFVTVTTIFLLLPSGFRTLFSIPIYILSVCFIASLCITSPNISPAGFKWFWVNFIVICVETSVMFICFGLLSRFRRNRLVKAFPKARVVDPTLT